MYDLPLPKGKTVKKTAKKPAKSPIVDADENLDEDTLNVVEQALKELVAYLKKQGVDLSEDAEKDPDDDEASDTKPAREEFARKISGSPARKPKTRADDRARDASFQEMARVMNSPLIAKLPAIRWDPRGRVCDIMTPEEASNHLRKAGGQ